MPKHSILLIDTFDGAKPCSSEQGFKCRSVSTLSKVEWVDSRTTTKHVHREGASFHQWSVAHKRIEKHLTTHRFRVVSKTWDDPISHAIIEEKTPVVIIRCSSKEVLAQVRSLKKQGRLQGVLFFGYSETHAQASDVVTALESGVDDYIGYPFHWQIFRARINALIRRASFQSETNQHLRYKNIRVNLDAQTVLVNSKKIALTPKEFGLLCYFLKNEGKVLTRSYLMEHIWEYSYFGTTRTVDKHVENLRNKLGKIGKDIVTVERSGYKMG